MLTHARLFGFGGVVAAFISVGLFFLLWLGSLGSLWFYGIVYLLGVTFVVTSFCKKLGAISLPEAVVVSVVWLLTAIIFLFVFLVSMAGFARVFSIYSTLAILFIPFVVLLTFKRRRN